MKVCRIHYEQMEKPDRDNTHAVKADNECRQMLLQYPNSVHVPETQQMLREIQEVIAEGEYRVGSFYARKGSYRAGVNRLQAVTDHYPLFSKSDEALWTLGNTYEKMGEQYQDSSVDAYVKLVRDYPLSPYVDPAKERLTAFNHEIPQSDPKRLEVMKFNVENRTEQSMFGKVFGMFGTRPDLRQAARMGDPTMTAFTPTTPPGVTPTSGIAPVQPSAEVTAETISGPSKLDTEPDARQGGAGGQPQQQQPQQQQPQP
jgi:outer membrane protein assembly factor BamD